MEFIYGIVFGLGLPLVAALIVAIWLVLLIRFGGLPLILERREVSTDLQMYITRNATRVVLGLVVIGVPFMPFLCCNMQFLSWLGEFGTATLGEKASWVIFSFLYSPVQLILIVEGWLVLICHFRWHYLSCRLDMPIGQGQNIYQYSVRTLLVIGVTTGLVGLGWWTSIPEDKFEDAYRLGLVVLSPAASLLTIGMVIMLPISLARDLKISGKDEHSATVARNTTLALQATFLILSVIGGIWSVLMYHTYWYGTDVVPG